MWNLNLIIFCVLITPSIAFCQIENRATQDSIRKSRLEKELEDLGQEFVLIPKLSKDSIYNATKFQLSLYFGVCNGSNVNNRPRQLNNSKIIIDNSYDFSAEVFIKLKDKIGISTGFGFMQSSLVLESDFMTTKSTYYSYFEPNPNGIDSSFVYGYTYKDTVQIQNDWIKTNSVSVPIYFVYRKKWCNNVGYAFSGGLNLGIVMKHDYYSRSLGFPETDLKKISLDLLTRHEFFYSFGGFQAGIYTKIGWNAMAHVKFNDYKRNVIISGLGFACHFKL